jgi:hypothetical protein
MFVDFLNKAFKLIFNMITEDKIAAATLAQIFGSELHTIDQSITHKSANTPRTIQLDPKQILLGSSNVNNNIHSLQQEAEHAFPYHQPQPQPQPQPLQGEPQRIATHSPSVAISGDSAKLLERMCESLEKIAFVLESSEVVLKKPKRLRSEKTNES